MNDFLTINLFFAPVYAYLGYSLYILISNEIKSYKS